jgi:hypothetical protein
MPDSPCCHIPLAFGYEGALCRKCLTVYTHEAVSRMPGFDPHFYDHAIHIFALFMATGALEPGLNQVLFEDDGVIIIHTKLPL